MMMQMKVLAFVLVALIQFAGRGISQVILSSSAGLNSAVPTKEKAVETLREFLAAYKAGNTKKMKSLVKPPPHWERKSEIYYFNYLRLSRLDAQKLAVAINTLAAKGKWGKSTAIHKAIGGLERCVDNLDVSLDNCYTLLYNEDSGIDFHWDGTKLLIIRFDDVGDIK